MPLAEIEIAPGVFPFRALVLLDPVAGVTRKVTLFVSDVTVSVGPVYKADQASAGGAAMTWSAGTVVDDVLAIPNAVGDGDQIMLLPAGVVDSSYQAPAQAARSFWIAPFEGTEGGYVQVAVDRVSRGGA